MPNERKPGEDKAIDVTLLNDNIQQPKQKTDNTLLSDVSEAKQRLPYAFVPIETNNIVLDTPIWHDGSSGGKLLSGEILCTLKALTPLMPGNARYSVEKADEDKLKSWNLPNLGKDKQIAEPLRLPDGRVVIAGSALKGMIRHSLSVLLSAPMERVAEHRYTYRPNLDHAPAPARYECRPAIVTGKDQQGEWIITVLPAEKNIKKGARRDTKNSIVQFIRRNEKKPKGAASFCYRGGIDGEGILAGAKEPPTITYNEACVDFNIAKSSLTIPTAVYKAYEDTQQILKQDHLEGHPLIDSNKQREQREVIGNAISKSTSLCADQLIYVEVEIKNGKPSAIVSMGHHYQYRWRYTSSVRQQNNKVRTYLAVHQDEEQAQPKQLTGARLFFGYVKNEDVPIGKKEYERLAGRIAPNHAVSRAVPQYVGKESSGYSVPLKILGQPKPSAYEFYLQQPASGKLLQTYGDLAGDVGGELAGRKYYPHQPNATENDIQTIDRDTIQGNQATLARFICKPTTEFRFTLRFARLRNWELGALLAVLEPARLAEKNQSCDYAHKLGLGRPLGMGSVTIQVDKLNCRPEQEIGMQEKDAAAQSAYVDEAKKQLIDKDNLTAWLAMHRYDKNEVVHRHYPQASTTVKGKKIQTIYAWHSKIRRKHARLRR